jgi:hypothetical protein
MSDLNCSKTFIKNLNHIISDTDDDPSVVNDPLINSPDIFKINKGSFKRLFLLHIKTSNKKVPFSEIVIICK